MPYRNRLHSSHAQQRRSGRRSARVPRGADVRRAHHLRRAVAAGGRGDGPGTPRLPMGDAMIVGPLDRSSPIPLYFQIAESLTEAIKNGAIAPRERLDNELELAERLGVSRPTVRQAVQRLVQQGLVIRRRGLGTLVVAPRILRPVALTSLYDDLSAASRHPTTVVLSAQQIEAHDEIAQILSVAAGTPVLSIERLRSADETPLAIMHNYLPASLLQGRPETDLEKVGLYELLRSLGVQLHAADQVIGARRSTAQEARLLQAPRGATVLTMTRTAFDPVGVPVEHGRHAYLADRYSFKMSLVAQ